MKKLIFTLCFLFSFLLITNAQEKGASKETVKIAWSHYTGWEFWGYLDKSGIMKKWGDKYGVNVEISLINDYIESINLYTAGKYDGCAMTNMDLLTIPAMGGKDSTVLIIGDYSNGNDGIVSKVAKSVKELKGLEVKLVQNSVSHYLLTRALQSNGMTEKELKLINQSDADIGAKYEADPKGTAVTWNPILMKLRDTKGTNLIFDSSKIPGEILDLLVVRSNLSDNAKKALVGAWFEVMQIMTKPSAEKKEAIKYMAESSGCTEAEFNRQLETTAMYYDPKEAVKFAESPKLKETMEYVRTFCFEHGLFEGASSKDHVGILFPDGTIQGHKDNIRVKFDTSYMKQVAEGKL